MNVAASARLLVARRPSAVVVACQLAVDQIRGYRAVPAIPDEGSELNVPRDDVRHEHRQHVRRGLATRQLATAVYDGPRGRTSPWPV